MSYILDALKKAERERKRGKIPDFTANHETPEDRPNRKLWVYLILFIVVAAAGGGGFFLGADKLSGNPVFPNQNTQVMLNTPVQAQPPAPTSAAPSSENIAETSSINTVETKAPIKEVKVGENNREADTKQTVKAKKENKVSSVKKSVPSEINKRINQLAAKNSETAAAKKAVPGNRIYSIAELPDEIRDKLPAFSISTHIYSQDKSERLASINGHIGHEGQEIMPGIKLESIIPDGAVLRYQDYRFRISLK
jgi:general secretion pathway protein B